MKTSFVSVILAGGLACAATAQAQNFVIDWFTVDGGGGTSTGGVYTVRGTIGQPDAAQASGGVYSLVGGFWGVTVLQTPGAPLLGAELLAGGSVRVFWPRPATGFVLECTTALLQPANTVWSPVSAPYDTNATHVSVTLPMASGKKVFRLKR